MFVLQEREARYTTPPGLCFSCQSWRQVTATGTLMHITHTPHYRNHTTHHTTPHHINHTPYRSIGVFEMVNHMIEPLPFLIPTRYIFNIYDIIIKIEPRIDQDHLPSLQSHEMRGRN